VPSISLATVYNTLEAFCQAGIAQKLPGAGANGSARFDAIRENHLHLRDQRTGEVTDVPHTLSRDVLERIPQHVLSKLEAELGFRISQVQVELIGEHGDDEEPLESPVSKSSQASQA
jgi:Fe2+ or Zn2+ uptake regulation protein